MEGDEGQGLLDGRMRGDGGRMRIVLGKVAGSERILQI